MGGGPVRQETHPSPHPWPNPTEAEGLGAEATRGEPREPGGPGLLPARLGKEAGSPTQAAASPRPRGMRHPQEGAPRGERTRKSPGWQSAPGAPTPEPRAHPGTSVTAASAGALAASSAAREKSGSQLAPSVAIFLL